MITNPTQPAMSDTYLAPLVRYLDVVSRAEAASDRRRRDAGHPAIVDAAAVDQTTA